MRAETIGPIVDGLRTAIRLDMPRVDHLLHMRCEVTHPEIGREVLDRVMQDLQDIGKVEQHPSFEGRTMSMVVAPLKVI